jgi:hypothetical protein
MAEKSQKHELKKPSKTLKERRAIKREKMAEHLVPRRRQPSR